MNYAAERAVIDGVEVLRLTDAAQRTEVAIVPARGNNAHELMVDGKNLLWSPFPLSGSWKYAGNFFMAPWANRLEQDAFHANGKKYLLNPDLRNFHRDSRGLPMHGLLANWPEWKVVALEADAKAAYATCRVEFWKYPTLAAQFPFAHTVEMTYRLRAGVVEVETAVRNESVEPMPVSLGYHPFFRIHDAPRGAWKVHLAARRRMVLTEMLLPTGEREPLETTEVAPSETGDLTGVYTDLVRDEDGRARFWVEGERERITMACGEKYDVVVTYAPPGEDYVCLEPMAGTINAMNLAAAGRYPELQSIAPGGEWRESYWIEVSGM